MRKVESIISKIKSFLSHSVFSKKDIRLVLTAAIVGFLATVNYNIFKIIKDTLVLSMPNKEVTIILPALKIWAVVPASMLAVYIINLLNRYVGLSFIFYVIASFYISLLYILSLSYANFPNLYLTSIGNSIIDFANSTHTSAIIGPIALIVKYWPIVIVYILSELWGTTIYLLVFWGLLNTFFTKKMTLKIYPVLNLVANSAGIFTKEIFGLSYYFSRGLEESKGWEGKVIAITRLSSFVIMIMLVAFFFVVRDLKKIDRSNEPNIKTESNKKERPSLIHGIKTMTRSPYVGTLVSTIVLINIILNLTEVMWKGMLSQTYQGDGMMISEYLSSLIRDTSITSVATGLLLPFLINGIGVKWTFTSLPVVSMIFIGAFALKQYTLTVSMTNETISPDMLAPYINAGHIGIVILRAGKYTIYDSIKDICLNILKYRDMIEAKSLLDAVFSRVGKSVASTHYSATSAISKYVADSSSAILIISTGVIWVIATYFLGTLYEKRTSSSTG